MIKTWQSPVVPPFNGVFYAVVPPNENFFENEEKFTDEPFDSPEQDYIAGLPHNHRSFAAVTG